MIHLIPTPKSCTVVSEELHTLPVSIQCTVAEWDDVTDAFCESFSKIFETSIKRAKSAGISLMLDETLETDAYRLDSTAKKLVLRASTRKGISYALATTLQLLSYKNGQLSIPSLKIEDRPDKEYRAFMLDGVSAFHPLSKVLKYVDLCFFYKVDHLHLHFADNAAYAYPSKAFPKLPTPKKHYTYEEIAELNRYADARGIKLVPEFEAPGHANALNTAYPEIFANKTDGEERKFYSELGDLLSPESLICVGSDRAVEGVKTLLAEICELFPNAPYIHIGGDEATHQIWEGCPDCVAYMKEHGIRDSYELYSEYVGRLASYLLSIGRTPMVWEGFPKESSHHVPKETVVIAWESHYQTAPDLLKNGFKIVNASWQPTYFVPSLVHRWGPVDLLNWNVYNWQHWWKESVAYLNPIHVQPTDDVLGASLCSWGLGYEQLITRLLENMPAFSERTWNVERKADFDTYHLTYKSLVHKSAMLIRDHT